ncbi:hypothetical protein [Victivallis vadensis]|jgi:hypothetical protein|uniref:Uncharacterized protein n=1 Tax=Victivallis vadensis TaxID=172901 RepID=A0A2U1AJI5_9BACT|nr:hypothetical protein [Victivallis vadensis]NMD88703.1 hypothetical protein [Victivallis vadensis]PVY36545.1 hypothetical protein C8D82_13511 [Victivallis vadensis]HJH02945.1 hypothetical protein [Victivallis vadensis]
MISLLSFVVALAVQALFFYLATRITGNKTSYGTLFAIALIGSICSAIPAVGFLIGLIVVLFLLVYWGKMSWGSAILTVLLAYILAVVITVLLGLALGFALFSFGSAASSTAAGPAAAILLLQ